MAEPLSKPIIDMINRLVFDKTITRPDLIEALEEVEADLDSLLDSLRDDERRAQGGDNAG